MSSVITALLGGGVELKAGAVVPIDYYKSKDPALAKLVAGGALFVVARAGKRTWLVAIVEKPDLARVKTGDTRAHGVYGPRNATPITDITKARIAFPLAEARVLTPKEEAAIRRLVDADAETDGAGQVVTAAARVAAPMVSVDPKAPPLARAAALLANGQVAPAITAMVEAWRAAKSPSLGDAIDRATRLLPTYDRPLLATRYQSKDSDRAWTTAFRDHANTLPQLLQTVELDGDAWTRKYKRLRAILGLPPDPRIARWLVAYSGKTATADGQGWRGIAEGLLAAKDPRTKPLLLAIEPRLQDDRDQYVVEPTALAELFTFARSADVVVPAGERGAFVAIATLCEMLEAPRRMECSLVDAIAERPDDPDVYQVYADWLQERQHPRGEYIALVAKSAAGGLSAAQARRLAAFDDVPFLFGAIDELAMAHTRPRPHGIDRTLLASWKTTDVGWQDLAAQPLARALAEIELSGDARFARIEGLAAFARGAAHLATVIGVPNTWLAQFVKLTDGAFAAKAGVLRRVRAAS